MLTVAGKEIIGRISSEKARRTRVPLYQSSVRLLSLMIGAIFLSESLVMLLLSQLPQLPPVSEALLDSAVLIVILSPILHFLFFRPFRYHLLERRKSEEEVRSLSHQLIAASEEERRKLSRDLHDEFGQAVTLLQLETEYLGGGLPAEDTERRRRHGELLERIRVLGDNIRNFSTALRPEILDDLGLVPALQWHVRQLSGTLPDLKLDFRVTGLKRRLPADVEIVLYRVCQEALNNIVCHAHASQVTIRLTFSHPDVILTVRDDGRGFEGRAGSAGRKGLGLLSMRERVAAAGGILAVASKPGKGTEIRVELPTGAGAGDDE